MIRGGHVDVAVMGGLQVDEEGNLANWAVSRQAIAWRRRGQWIIAAGAKKADHRNESF
jgi:3-oxoacid CoA-transferase